VNEHAVNTPPHEPLRIVLLGASGFIGSALLRQMHGTHTQPHLLVHHTPPASMPAQAQSHRGSLSELPTGLLPEAPHVVIHCASKQVDADGSGYGVNLRGIEALCQRIAEQGAARHTRAVLFVSSCSVYGSGPQLRVRESAPLRPDTPLARSRAACEARLHVLADHSACRVEVFRPRFVLGLGDQHVLPGLARLTERGLTLGNGEQRFSVIDVDDLARILLARASHALHSERPTGFDAFNVGYERPISLHEIQELLCEHFDLDTPRRHIPTPERLVQAAVRMPVPPLQRLAQRLSLFGLTHHMAIARLAATLETPWLGRDPRTVLRRATQWLPPQRHAYRWNH
jgi:nucleoside-diphosphate-sugar epimerase